MLQRNDTGSAHLFPTLDPPVEVQVGEIVDYPQLLEGFSKVDELDKDEHGAEVPPVAVVEAPEPVEPGPTSLDSGISDGTPPPDVAQVGSIQHSQDLAAQNQALLDAANAGGEQTDQHDADQH